MAITLDGTSGITTPDITSSGALGVDASAPDNSLVVDSSGNVGVGTSSPSTKLHLETGSGDLITTMAGASRTWQLRNQSDGNLGLYDSTAAAWRTFWDTSGNLLVGTTSAVGKVTISDQTNRGQSDAQFSIAGSGYTAHHFLDSVAYSIGQNSNSRNLKMYSGSNSGTGVQLAAGGTSWGTYSDERMIDIIEPISDGLNKVLTLRTVIGKYKTDDADKRRSMLIAQDVQAVLPEATTEDADGMLSLAYTDLIPLLTAAIQEQQELITAQQTAIETLEARVAALEAA